MLIFVYFNSAIKLRHKNNVAKLLAKKVMNKKKTIRSYHIMDRPKKPSAI
jgi:hypothetical protein